MIKAGNSYGAQSYGEPVDYFRYAKFTMLNSDFKILFDMKERRYLPEMQKVKDAVQSNGCNAVCDVKNAIDYDEQKVALKEDGATSKDFHDLVEFEEKFNNEHLKEIKMFLISPMTIYKIDQYCIKLLKGIKFAEFIDKEFSNRALKGELDDLYDGG